LREAHPPVVTHRNRTLGGKLEEPRIGMSGVMRRGQIVSRRVVRFLR
jgi:hypothetical protein